jgi:hypothetical protein
MARTIGMVALLLGTLALVGCGMDPYGYGGYGGYGGNGGYGSYGGGCPQSYGSMPLPIPMPMDSGYGGGYSSAAPYYQSQPYPDPQPYYVNGAPGYPPQYQADPYGSPYDRRQAHWQNVEMERRLHYQMDRNQQRMASGQLDPQEYQRLQAEQDHLRGTLGRTRGDGRFGPQESARLNQIQNRNSQATSRFNHNGATVPFNSGTTSSSNGSTTGSRVYPGSGNVVQPGNGSMAWGGRFQPGNGAMAQPGPVNGPRFQPNNRMMMRRPQAVNGARFQPRPQMMRPGPGPRSQPRGGGMRRISYPHGG